MAIEFKFMLIICCGCELWVMGCGVVVFVEYIWMGWDVFASSRRRFCGRNGYSWVRLVMLMASPFEILLSMRSNAICAGGMCDKMGGASMRVICWCCGGVGLGIGMEGWLEGYGVFEGLQGILDPFCILGVFRIFWEVGLLLW